MNKSLNLREINIAYLILQKYNFFLGFFEFSQFYHKKTDFLSFERFFQKKVYGKVYGFPPKVYG